VKARQIIAALSLAKSLSVPQAERCIIRSPKDVADLLRPEIGYQQREHFVVLFLDTKNRLIAKETIAIGSLNACIVHPREVLKAAIKRSSATIVLSHNHPSGDTNPSQEDIQITTRLIDAGNIIGIEILDHVIVGLDRHYSLKENGHM
jgi:DNA repair protein RadC